MGEHRRSGYSPPVTTTAQNSPPVETQWVVRPESVFSRCITEVPSTVPGISSLRSSLSFLTPAGHSSAPWTLDPDLDSVLNYLILSSNSTPSLRPPPRLPSTAARPPSCAVQCLGWFRLRPSSLRNYKSPPSRHEKKKIVRE